MQEDIEQQQRLLATHRGTLAVYLERQARQGLAHVDPEVVHGIDEARLQISRIKETLHGWGVAVADHPDDEPPSSESIGAPGENLSVTPWPTGIPDDRYYPLPGRERQITSMVDELASPHGSPLLVITGLGGLGKTAAAAEVARRLLQHQHIEGVIGDSAKEQVFAGGEIVQLHNATLDFDTLLDSIARQLGRWDIPTLKAAEKRSVLGRLLQQHRYLILVDNLETAENAQALVAQLRAYLGRSRALVTSRERVADDAARPFTLSELEVDDSLFFLRTDAGQRGVNQLIGAPHDLLLDIHHITGGAPLALKLVVAQARFFDVRLILDQLRDTGAKLYTYIYRRAWEQLLPAAQRMLIYIGQTVVTTVGWPELRAVDIAESDQELMAAIDQLIAYSLLNVVTADSTIRYGIHQITRHFVTSGLPELWQEQGLL